MERKLNTEVVRIAADKEGYSLTKLAHEIGVSTQSVSKWLKGDAIPRPGKALKLGRLLALSYEQMFGPRDLTNELQVAFRLSQNRVASDEHKERARELGRMYEQLVPYLPFKRFEAPPRLKNPIRDYDYLLELCQTIRKEMGLEAQERISLPSMLSHFAEKLQAVVVPVFWGHRQGGAELAAHIYSPKTKTTWVPFNLDTKVWDTRFWVAHELAHAYTFESLDEKAGELFSDAFAGTLVFPEAHAKAAYQEVGAARSKKMKLEIALRYAEQMGVSPVCVAKQVDRYALARELSPVGAEFDGIYAALAVNPVAKAVPTVGAELFGEAPPSVSQLREVSKTVFKSPFFDALSQYLKANGGNPAFVQGVLDCPLSDAKAINSELA